MKGIRYGVIVGFVGLMSASQASPTALVSIPIADTLGHREVAIGHTITGFQPSVDKKFAHSASFTIGGFDRFEFGGSTDYLGYQTLSLKYSLWDSPSWAPNTALAIGVMNVRGKDQDRYVVGRYDLGSVRFHAGAARLGNVGAGIFGIDADLKFATGQADHISGKDGYTWIALARDLGSGFDVQFALGRPNAKENGWQHFYFAGYGFRF
jgi:hypothetical protein